jgi:hypothetical protein
VKSSKYATDGFIACLIQVLIREIVGIINGARDTATASCGVSLLTSFAPFLKVLRDGQRSDVSATLHSIVTVHPSLAEDARAASHLLAL